MKPEDLVGFFEVLGPLSGRMSSVQANLCFTITSDKFDK